MSEEQKIMQKLAATFTEKEIIPVAGEFDEKEEIPWAVVEKAFNTGLMNLKVPLEYGGQGLDHVTSAVITEEISYGCLGINGTFGANELALTPLLIAGTAEQKRKILPEFCSAPQLAAFVLTEPEAGSDVSAVRTTAVLRGDEYIINGKKCFITNGGVASLYIVFASVNQGKGGKKLSAFIVSGDTPGLSGGKKESKMGDRASHIAEVILEEVKVPRDNLLGKEGDGFKIAMQTLDETRPGIGAAAVGVARRALNEALQHCRIRHQFGRPLIANQGLQFMIADMAMQVAAARLLVWQAAAKLDLGMRATLESAMSKCFAADVAMKVAVDSLQLMGGYGYMRDYPLEKLMRDAKVLQIYEGTNQIQRAIIAAELVKG